ncbi:MAG: alpha/beta fold hydrolase [Demequina sp.]|nr:alpha/beta fold hydrolase [Demequina sp.]
MLAFDRAGTGEPVVLIHGMGHHRQAWAPVTARLRQHREVITVDLPGHGQSPDLTPDSRPLIDVIEESFVALFEHLGLARPHLVGNSLGGRIALDLASRAHAGSVTALNPAGFWAEGIEFAYTKAIFAALVRGSRVPTAMASAALGSAAGRRLLMGILMAHPERLPADAAVADLAAFRRAGPALELIMAQASTFEEKLPDDITATIAWSDRDRILLRPQRNAARARTKLPTARHRQLPGCGHIPMFDDPDAITSLILEATSPSRATAATT